MKVLKLLMLREKPLDDKTFFRLLWALCVLYERHELAHIYPMIEVYIRQAQKGLAADAYNIYYCYLYLRTVCPQLHALRDHIHSLMDGHFLETRSSETQL